MGLGFRFDLPVGFSSESWLVSSGSSLMRFGLLDVVAGGELDEVASSGVVDEGLDVEAEWGGPPRVDLRVSRGGIGAES